MFTRRGLLLIALILGALVAAAIWTQSRNVANDGSNRRIVVYIASAVEIEPIAQLRNGFRESLDKSSLGAKIQYVERNAQNDPGLMAQIADEIARTRPDLVYVLGSSLAQAIQKRAPDVVLVQGGVTDPVTAGLAASWEGSGRLYAATSDRPPVRKLMAIMKALLPGRTIIGVLYNPSEPNSLAVVRELKALGPASGFQVREFAVGQASDLPAAASAAARSSQIVFVPPDNSVTAGLGTVIQTATSQGIPVVATTEDAVKQGALVAVTTDYTVLGRESATIALAILRDRKNPATMPIYPPSDARVVVSAAQARRFNIDLASGASLGFSLVN